MLREFIFQRLIENLDFEPTKGQFLLLEELSAYIDSSNEKEVFLIKGYAGTGKTTIVNALVRTLNSLSLNSVLLAPTGRAAKVLSSYTSTISFTIHKKIYRQKSSFDSPSKFLLDRNLHKDTFFFVDEASMIGGNNPDNSVFGSGDLLFDLETYVHSGHNCKLILIGDLAQLPPVGLQLSPALDKLHLESMGLQVREIFLRDVVRQALGSGILANATEIREKIERKDIGFPKFKLDQYIDIVRIGGTEIVEEIENCYSKYGEDETIVICRSNKQANKYNMGIRNRILWREEEISIGDLMMVVKNNYFWKPEGMNMEFIANGDIVRLERINKYQNLYDGHFADVLLGFIDYKNLTIDAKIMTDVLSIESASIPYAKQNELFELILKDYPDESNRKKQIKKVLENPFFNALQVKFAYAVTCHKAQGGQWKAVFVDPGFFREDMLAIEYLRWMYTALTRATEKLYLVNFPDMFFED